MSVLFLELSGPGALEVLRAWRAALPALSGGRLLTGRGPGPEVALLLVEGLDVPPPGLDAPEGLKLRAWAFEDPPAGTAPGGRGG